MLPSRPRLQSWDPGSLTTAEAGIKASGTTVHDTVTGIERNVTAMPEAKTWSGQAHDAAVRMFGRSSKKAEDFSKYTDAVGTALSNGAGPIGTARTNLLNKAREIEEGDLYVDDRWVVQIKPAGMTAEKAAELEKQAQAQQITVNTLLINVGAADENAANSLQSAAKDFGFSASPHVPLGKALGAGPPPGDEVPNPLTPVGAMQQAMLRDQEMSTTVREKKTEVHGAVTTTTLQMMDGSKHVIEVDGEDRLDKGTITSDTFTDKNGKEQYTVSSFQYKDTDLNALPGAKVTEIEFTDGTYVSMVQHVNGTTESMVRTADGRTGALPPKFFSDPIPTLAGGALSGLAKQSETGIPMLSPELSAKVGAGAKWGGPVLGIAVATYHTLTAPSAHEKCVAAVTGTWSLGGGVTADAMLGVMAPEASPWLAVPVNMFGSWAFGYGGALLGEAVCPR